MLTRRPWKKVENKGVIIWENHRDVKIDKKDRNNSIGEFNREFTTILDLKKTGDLQKRLTKVTEDTGDVTRVEIKVLGKEDSRSK